MKAIFEYVGTNLQSKPKGMVDCINVLIWGGVKLTKFLKDICNQITEGIRPDDTGVYTLLQSRRDNYYIDRNTCIKQVMLKPQLNASRRIPDQVRNDREGHRAIQSRRATFWKNLMSGGGCAARNTQPPADADVAYTPPAMSPAAAPPAGSTERDTCINQEMLSRKVGGAKQVQHDIGGTVYKRGTVYLENIPDTVEINPKPLENIPNTLKINPNTLEIIPNTLEIVSDTLEIIPDALEKVSKPLEMNPNALEIVPDPLEIIPNESKLMDFNNKPTFNTLFIDKFTEFCNKCKNMLQMEAYHLTNKLHHYTHSRMAANCITLNTYLL